MSNLFTNFQIVLHVSKVAFGGHDNLTRSLWWSNNVAFMGHSNVAYFGGGHSKLAFVSSSKVAFMGHDMAIWVIII